MQFAFRFTPEARLQLAELESNPALSKRLKAVKSVLAKLQTNPRHPGLNTHKYLTKKGPNGAETFEAYAENNTPGAFRIFWCYGPDKNAITILTITAHP